MLTLSVDIETYSPVDLAEAGVYRYAEHEDFEVLLISYAFDDGEVRTIQPHLPDEDGYSLEFARALTDPAILKTAWNANFERTCLAVWYGKTMPPEQWQDTMIMAMECGLPGALAAAGAALGLPEEKLKDPVGKSLIQYFSRPCRPTRANGGRTRNMPHHDPEKWQLYVGYNQQDVVTEREIRNRLRIWMPAASEWENWRLDQHINDYGIMIDEPMVRGIVQYDEKRREELLEEARQLTGLENPNSLAQLKTWLAGKSVPVETLRKDDLTALLEQELPADVARALEIRQALGKTSTAKYSAMLDAVCSDGRVHGLLQFYGASRSGRWAGRLVQVQNLARNSLPDLGLARDLVRAGEFEQLETLFGEPAFVFSELVRTAFIAPEGRTFVVSDFSAIEARVVAWLAGEEWVLQAFRDGKDIYCETASQMYHVPVEKHGANGHLRQKGKIAVLACGYGGGVGALQAMDSSGSIPEDEKQAVVDSWRMANPKIVKLWRDYERSAMTAIEERRTVRHKSGVSFCYAGGHLFVYLPCGRKLCYWQTRIREDPKTGRGQIVYMGVNQTTRQWTETETWGGKLVENVVQAVARDCLAEAMQRVDQMGYSIVMHIHDEMVIEAPEEDWTAVPRITEAMGVTPAWARGLPLKGETYVTGYYKKD